MRRRLPLPTIIVVIFILIAILLPGSSLPQGPHIPGFDKLVHSGMFMALALAVCLDFRLVGVRRLLSVLVAVFAFAALTEISQLFVPGRSCDGFDLVADMAGFVVGLSAHRIAAAFAARLS
ncbi:MAG TPA: VanZ family protein [bacterium]|nr:VanZ family protein [bacterium]